MAAIPVGGCQSEPLLGGGVFDTGKYLDVPDSATEAILLSAGIGEAHEAGFGFSEIYHWAACQMIVPLVGKDSPAFTIC